jgi:hypothetical protein
MNGAAEAAGVTPIGGTGLDGPTGVAGDCVGAGDPHADKVAKINAAIPATSSKREGFILILL